MIEQGKLVFSGSIDEIRNFNNVFKTPCPATSDLESDPFLSISSKYIIACSALSLSLSHLT